MNHLEQLVAEWCEYKGYFVRRNVRVGKRARGGYAGELDVVAFHPVEGHLVHIETTMDAQGWDERSERYEHKFGVGREFIPTLFRGFDLPGQIDQVVVLGFGGKGGRTSLAGGRIVLIAELLSEILSFLEGKSMNQEAVPDQYGLLRTLHFVAQHKAFLRAPTPESRPNSLLPVNRQ
jgi:hypothetical protein